MKLFLLKQAFQIVCCKNACARTGRACMCLNTYRSYTTEGSGENVIATGRNVNTTICMPMHAQMELRFFFRSAYWNMS